jgi:hypothetical protein
LRYVGFYGDRRTKRILRAALRWEVLPYQKRESSPARPAEVLQGNPAAKAFAAASIS